MGSTERDRHLSAFIPTPPADVNQAERRAYERYATSDAAPLYRERLGRLYAKWHEYNRGFFADRLTAPHLSIGRTAPRRFGQCRLTTNYGGQTDITLSEGIVFAANRAVVVREYPADGYVRFEDDVLLGETVKQYVLETLGATEEGYGGYGPLYAAEATRVGEALGLGAVAPRRRGARGAGLPVAAFWPWAFRPDGYYLGDVRLDGRRVAGLRAGPAGPTAAPVADYYLLLLLTGRADRLRALLERQVEADTAARLPVVARAERGPLAADGRPLPVPALAPDWVRWHDRCPARIAEHVADRRAFDLLPVLADALEDGGCDDPLVLEHCRRPAVHTADCWVLRAVRAADAGPGGG